MTILFAITFVSLSSLVMAQDRKAMNADEHIMRSLLSASISLGISRYCPTIEVRQIFALFKAFELRNYARGLGYSNDEINAFNNDPVQQEQFRVWAWDYLHANGVTEGDTESFCALGRHEIERKSLTGRLLRDTGKGEE